MISTRRQRIIARSRYLIRAGAYARLPPCAARKVGYRCYCGLLHEAMQAHCKVWSQFTAHEVPFNLRLALNPPGFVALVPVCHRCRSNDTARFTMLRRTLKEVDSTNRFHRFSSSGLHSSSPSSESITLQQTSTVFGGGKYQPWF